MQFEGRSVGRVERDVRVIVIGGDEGGSLDEGGSCDIDVEGPFDGGREAEGAFKGGGGTVGRGEDGSGCERWGLASRSIPSISKSASSSSTSFNFSWVGRLITPRVRCKVLSGLKALSGMMVVGPVWRRASAEGLGASAVDVSSSWLATSTSSGCSFGCDCARVLNFDREVCS